MTWKRHENCKTPRCVVVDHSELDRGGLPPRQRRVVAQHRTREAPQRIALLNSHVLRAQRGLAAGARRSTRPWRGRRRPSRRTACSTSFGWRCTSHSWGRASYPRRRGPSSSARLAGGVTAAWADCRNPTPAHTPSHAPWPPPRRSCAPQPSRCCSGARPPPTVATGSCSSLPCTSSSPTCAPSAWQAWSPRRPPAGRAGPWPRASGSRWGRGSRRLTCWCAW